MPFVFLVYVQFLVIISHQCLALRSLIFFVAQLFSLGHNNVGATDISFHFILSQYFEQGIGLSQQKWGVGLDGVVFGSENGCIARVTGVQLHSNNTH